VTRSGALRWAFVDSDNVPSIARPDSTIPIANNHGAHLKSTPDPIHNNPEFTVIPDIPPVFDRSVFRLYCNHPEG
jgi:hypothetical protein